MEHEYTSRGQGALNTVLGAIGTAGATGVLGNMGGLFGGNRCASEADHPVSRREADMAAEIAELKTEKKLLESNIYSDNKSLELYKVVRAERETADAKIAALEAQLNHQAVINAQVAANLSCLTNTVNMLSGLTKTIIPIDNICPPPMERYNSWVAPTAPATGA